jgi:hypothetical protein
MIEQLCPVLRWANPQETNQVSKRRFNRIFRSPLSGGVPYKMEQTI